mmetsp:Transcript_14103/g.47042  ORF Transcript_14103/g.47042 Transcript_14103/m.47042 type:complete len:463 (+) Transcript_14103:1524-2912(+)
MVNENSPQRRPPPSRIRRHNLNVGDAQLVHRRRNLGRAADEFGAGAQGEQGGEPQRRLKFVGRVQLRVRQQLRQSSGMLAETPLLEPHLEELAALGPVALRSRRVPVLHPAAALGDESGSGRLLRGSSLLGRILRRPKLGVEDSWHGDVNAVHVAELGDDESLEFARDVGLSDLQDAPHAFLQRRRRLAQHLRHAPDARPLAVCGFGGRRRRQSADGFGIFGRRRGPLRPPPLFSVREPSFKAIARLRRAPLRAALRRVGGDARGARGPVVGGRGTSPGEGLVPEPHLSRRRLFRGVVAHALDVADPLLLGCLWFVRSGEQDVDLRLRASVVPLSDHALQPVRVLDARDGIGDALQSGGDGDDLADDVGQTVPIIVPIQNIPEIVATQARVSQPLSQKVPADCRFGFEDGSRDGALRDRGAPRERGDDQFALQALIFDHFIAEKVGQPVGRRHRRHLAAAVL